MTTLITPFRDFFRKGDLILLGFCLATSFFGLALIFTATHRQETLHFVIVQFVAIVLGVVVYIIFTFLDFQLVTEKKWKWMVAVSVVLLLLLKTPLGEDYNSGNLNWLVLSRIIPGFPMDLQPNEIVKIPFVLLLAHLICKLQEGGHEISSLRSLALLGGFAAMMLGLIILICGDFGMCVMYSFIFITLVWVAGVKLRWFVLGGGAVVGGAVALWNFVLPETSYWNDYRIMRFRVVMDHSLDPLGRGYQQARSLLAIGSGRIFGRGFLQGTQTQAAADQALPARHTDFIFAVCGEELGLVGCLALVLLLCCIVLRCIWVGRHANSPFSAYLCMGMAGMLLVQVFFNIGMCLFILPVMGLTLPFVSYGGSSIITLYAAMGIVSSVKARTLPGWLRDRSHV